MTYQNHTSFVEDKKRKPAPKRQIDWFPAPPPPPPLPEHLTPITVPVIEDEEEEIIIPKVVEEPKEDLNLPTFVPNLAMATRNPMYIPPEDPTYWKDRFHA